MMENETIDNIRVENDYEHETVADIAAVLRRYVLPSLAERLEAAWERERATLGNAAATREVMNRIMGSFYEGCDRRHYAKLYEDDYRAITAALSAPARNCDLYATATEALKAQDVAFNEDNFKNGECRLGCPGCDDGLIDCKILWLFAPAAERKGEGDGR